MAEGGDAKPDVVEPSAISGIPRKTSRLLVLQKNGIAPYNEESDVKTLKI
jgi:hypothetical protein